MQLNQLYNKEFNFRQPVTSSQGDVSSNLFRRITKGIDVWYVAEVPNSADYIYHVTTNLNGHAGVKLTFKTNEGSFEEVGVWRSNPDALFNATGVDIRDKHLMSYIISLDKLHSVENYGPDMYIDVLYFQENVLTTFTHFKEKAQEYADKLQRTVYIGRRSAGGGSATKAHPATLK